MITLLHKILNRVDRIFEYISSAAMFLMMISICVDAGGRYLFNMPFEENFELTGKYFMVMVVFLLLSSNYSSHGHVRLDLLTGVLKCRMGLYYERLISAICLLAFIPLSWFAIEEFLHRVTADEVSFAMIDLPSYVSYMWLPLGCIALTARLLLEIVQPYVEETGL